MKELFHDLFSQTEGMPFSITYPDGTSCKYGGDGEAKFNLIFKTEKAMRAILVNVDLGFGEAYMVGDIDIEGSLIDRQCFAESPGTVACFLALPLPAAHLRKRQAVHLRAIRSRQRLLSVVVGQGHAVYVRVLQDARGFN